jgi:Ser/Thr protein kinase RdoA (MazF antagonist)
MALNSFENRVYDVELEPDESSGESNGESNKGSDKFKSNRRIVKFYRPGRWTREQILEEHAFLADLNAEEIPAVAPATFPDGQTLHQTSGEAIFFALFPKVGGRAPDELSSEQLLRIGRLLARIHAVGASKQAEHRIRLDPQTYGLNNLEFLLSKKWLPIEYEGRYQKVVKKICALSQSGFDSAQYQRIHGDCHLGNLLWNDSGSFFLDFDDMVQGPPVQDLWLLVPGRDAEAVQQRNTLLEGYEQIRHFDRRTLKLIEPLRALRFVHYAAWIARRWEDPAFPAAFPQFGSHRYWSDEVEDLERQLAIMVD